MAYPIMAARGMVGSIYLASDWVGGVGYMTIAQLQELAAAGWSIENHGRDATDLTTLDLAAQTAHLQTCQDYVTGTLGLPTPTTIHWPGGAYNADTLVAAAAVGLLTHVPTVDGFLFDGVKRPQGLAGLDLTGDDLATTLGKIDTNLAYPIFGLYAGEHGLVESGAGLTVAEFEAVCDYLVAHGCTTWTAAQWAAAAW